MRTKLNQEDRLSTFRVRCGIRRHRYTVATGLYAVGSPDHTSEVLVTANFKLTFDQLRCALKTVDAWVLVLDTLGVNVWCAAGKGTFSTSELVHQIQRTGLDQVVHHRRVIVPQLGATGVRARAVKDESGFRVVFGPVRADDIPRFLAGNRKATPDMRQVTFTFYERLILTPVELRMTLKPLLGSLAVLFVLSGLGPGLFSLSSAWSRGIIAAGALLTGVVSGAVITPALLPYIPVRPFALKGILTGSLAGLIFITLAAPTRNAISSVFALLLLMMTTSSFLAMNFTGATPFTAPSGVEKEMKHYIPVQMIFLLAAAGCWIYAAFI